MARSLNNTEPVAPDRISDAECVRRVQDGDTGSFEILVRRHQRATFNLIYRLLGDYDEAAEVAQEAFLSAYKSIGQFRGQANFSTWLYRIAFNHASTRRKALKIAQQRFVSLEEVDVVRHSDTDPFDNAAQKEVHERVQEALNSLDKQEAMVILLRDLQDIPYDQVAAILDIPIGTVKSRLYRARQALKARLSRHFYKTRKAS